MNCEMEACEKAKGEGREGKEEGIEEKEEQRIISVSFC